MRSVVRRRSARRAKVPFVTRQHILESSVEQKKVFPWQSRGLRREKIRDMLIEGPGWRNRSNRCSPFGLRPNVEGSIHKFQSFAHGEHPDTLPQLLVFHQAQPIIVNLEDGSGAVNDQAHARRAGLTVFRDVPQRLLCHPEEREGDLMVNSQHLALYFKIDGYTLVMGELTTQSRQCIL